MWRIGRKYPSRRELVVQENWRVIDAEYNGKPLIARFNAGLKSYAGHPEYKHQVGIAIPLKEPNARALPDVQEDRLLAAIEDEIARSLEVDRESIFAGVITTAGMREFVYYTVDPLAVQRKFEELRIRIKSHELQLMIQEDPDWGVFRRFV
jgi:hypothetical protein